MLLFCYLSASERLDQLLHCRDRKGFKNPRAAKQTIFPSRVLEEDFWKYVCVVTRLFQASIIIHYLKNPMFGSDSSGNNKRV